MSAGRGVAVPSLRPSPPESSLASIRASLAKESREEDDIPESTVTPAARHTIESSIDFSSHPDPLWKSLPPPPRWPAWEDRASSISSRQRQIAESERIKPPPVSGPAFTGFERFGWLATAVLIFGSLSLIMANGLLMFLWLAPWGNDYWFRIAHQNLLKPLVTLSSLVVRSAASWQSSAATAMLAAIALEQIQVPVLHLASISTIRNTNSGPYYFTWLMLDAFRRKTKWAKILVLALALVLSINTMLLQLTSTVLVLDLETAAVPGVLWQGNRSTSIPFTRLDLHHATGSSWRMRAFSYPAFGEYHEPPAVKEEGVSDTGLTMRSYLPIANQTVRESLKSYSGKAMVIDTRVKCVRPTLTNITIGFDEAMFNLSGSIKPEKWSNSSEAGHVAGDDNFNGFACYLPITSTNSPEEATQWRIILCAMKTDKVYLRSEFAAKWNPSTAPVYVVLNLTTGWAKGIDFRDFRGHGDNVSPFSGAGTLKIDSILRDPAAQPSVAPRNEWLDMTWEKLPKDPGDYTPKQRISNAHLQISISQCFTAYDPFELEVEVQSGRPRKEPAISFEPSVFSFDDHGRYRYNAVRTQLGQDPSIDADGRGIFQLQSRSDWLGPGTDSSGPNRNMQDVSSVGLDSQGANPAGGIPNIEPTQVYYYVDWDLLALNHTKLLMVEPSVAGLLQDILRTNGSLAFAIQSVQTVIAGLNYYDIVEHLEAESHVTQVSFVNLLVPIRRRGIIALTCVVLIHLILISAICMLFTHSTSASALGNAWQTLAQVNAPGAIDEILCHATLKTDSQVEKMVQPDFEKHCVGGIQRNADFDDETVCVTIYVPSPVSRHSLSCLPKAGTGPESPDSEGAPRKRLTYEIA